MLKKFLAAAAVTTALVSGLGATQAQAADSWSGTLSVAKSASVSPHVVVTINRFAPRSTFVVASYSSVSGGIRVNYFHFYGTQRCFGSTFAVLYVNGVAFQRTGSRFFNPGTRVVASFPEGGRFASIGTTFTWRWFGDGCQPAGYEQATVTRA